MVKDYLNQIIADVSRLARSSYQIGFVRGHDYLTEEQVSSISAVLSDRDGEEVVHEYEKQLAALIGPGGGGVSFAAGRMAFYALLRALGIGTGDEVILLGFTCSVMPNAVWRTGAKPVFADVHEDTFGSDPGEIASRITTRTKAVVAQHSFGIPCNIPEIVEICQKWSIAIIEDCAITLDATVDGVKVGNWGDAAIFSTDHSKPLNTLIGGFLYATNKALYEKVRKTHETLPQLSKDHQIRLFRQFLFERQYYKPENYRRRIGWDYLQAFSNKLLGASRQPIFLEKDYNKILLDNSPGAYPYPAAMPPFLARLGMMELTRWDREKKRRKELLADYVSLARRGGWSHYLPKAYESRNFDIVPLRFVFTHPLAKKITRQMSKFIDVDWTWFRSPIICTDNMADFGYAQGNCPKAERIGTEIINWPCVIAENWRRKLLEKYKEIVSCKL